MLNYKLIKIAKRFGLQLLLLLMSLSYVEAQTVYEVELLAKLDTASKDKIRSEIYVDLSDEAVYESPDRGFQYAEKALYFAQKAQDVYWITYANSCLGYCLYYKTQYKKALPYFKKDYKGYFSLKDTFGLIFSLSCQSDIYTYLGENKMAIELTNEALELAMFQKNNYEISGAYNQLGMVYLEMGELNKALDLLNRAYDIDLKLGDEELLSRTLNNLSLIYSEMGNFNDAFLTLKESIKNYDDEYDDEYDYGIYLVNMGGIFETMGFYDSALTYYMDYLKISRDFGSTLDEALALNEIANMQIETREYDNALQNVEKSIRIYKDEDIKVSLIEGYLTLGTIYLIQKSFKKANEVLSDAATIAMQTGSSNQEAEILKVKGKVAFAEGNYKDALKLYTEASSIFGVSNSKANYAETAYLIGFTLNRQGKVESAIEKTLEALSIIQQLNYRILLDDVYQLLSECYSKNEDFEQAYSYHVKFKNVQDSLLSLSNANRLAELQTVFYVNEKDAENKLLKSIQEENKVIIQRRTILGFILASGLVVLLFIAFWLFSINKERRRYNLTLETEVQNRTKELQVLNNDLQITNKELERFAYIASHDLKEPLRNIAGFTYLLKQKIKHLLTGEALEYMNFIERGTKQINELIVNVLEFSRLNGRKMDLQEVNMNSIVENIITNIAHTIETKKVALEIESLPTIIVDETKVTLVLKNLIENGIKYNQTESPLIHVGYEDNSENHIFYVKDNGIGIEKEYHEMIFEMFKRLHNKEDYEGTGIGLAFCEKVIHQHGGKIWLDKSGDDGSIFKFSIPKVIF